MVIKADQERVKSLLKDTITLLCKNGLHYKSEFAIEALIGITLDKNEVFLVNINETIYDDIMIQKSNTESAKEQSVSHNKCGGNVNSSSAHSTSSYSPQRSREIRSIPHEKDIFRSGQENHVMREKSTNSLSGELKNTVDDEPHSPDVVFIKDEVLSETELEQVSLRIADVQQHAYPETGGTEETNQLMLSSMGQSSYSLHSLSSGASMSTDTTLADRSSPMMASDDRMCQGNSFPKVFLSYVLHEIVYAWHCLIRCSEFMRFRHMFHRRLLYVFCPR